MSASKRERIRKALADSGIATAEGEWKDALLDRIEAIIGSKNVVERLTRDQDTAYESDQPGALDEIVLTGANVHLERMSRRNWMLIVETDEAHFHLNARDVTEYEMLVGGGPLAARRQLGRREEWSA